MIRKSFLFVSCLFTLILTACNVPDVPLSKSGGSYYDEISVAEVKSTGADAAIYGVTQVLEAKYWFQLALDAKKKDALLNFEPNQSEKYVTYNSRSKDYKVEKTYNCLKIQKVFQTDKNVKEYNITRNSHNYCGYKFGNTQVNEESKYRLTINYLANRNIKSVKVETSNRNIDIRKKIDKENENKLSIITNNSALIIELITPSGMNERTTSLYHMDLKHNGVYNLNLENDTHYSKEEGTAFLLSQIGSFEVDQKNNKVVEYFDESHLEGLKLHIPAMVRYVACKDRCKSFYKYRHLNLLTEIKELNFHSVADTNSDKVTQCMPVQGHFFVKYDVKSAKIKFKKGTGTIDDTGVQMVKFYENKTHDKLEAQWLNCINTQNDMPYIAEYHRLLIQ